MSFRPSPEQPLRARPRAKAFATFRPPTLSDFAPYTEFDRLLLRGSTSSSVSMASRVTALLKSRLSPTEFQRFTPHDIENLIGKRFLDEAAFAEATKEVLQDLPGEPLPGLLINSILKAFNPLALRAQGKTRQHVAFVYTSTRKPVV